MQKLFLLAVCCCLFAVSSCAKKTTAAVVGPNGTDYAALAASYKDNPAALRAYVEGCEDTQASLVELQRTAGNASQDAAALRENLQKAQMDNDQLRQQIASMQQQMAAGSTSDRLDTDQQAVVPGVIFQVQLGAYAQNTVNQDLSTGNALELQDQNGVQKVVVSQFRTYASAAKLRDRLKVMGVKDAFVVAKNNGTRITVPEALKLTGQN